MSPRHARGEGGGSSCAVDPAVRERVHFVRDPLGFDVPVYHDSAANAVAVTLGHNVAHDGWAVRRDLDGPRQSCTIDALRVRVHIKIADVGHRAYGTEDLIYDRFLGELADIGDFGF